MEPDPTAPGTQIKTWILDKIIAEEHGDVSIADYRALQLAALPFDCPNCPDTSGLVTLTQPDGSTVQMDCPLCLGMGKTAIEYNAVPGCTTWDPAPLPAPPPYVPPSS